MTKLLIPRSLIPKIIAICPVCDSGKVVTKVATPFADGYYRRHQCGDCGNVFHTLAPYDGAPAQVSATPFKDRDLSDYEAAVRMQQWDEQARVGTVTMEVTLISRIQLALAKPEDQRNDVDNYIVGVYHALERKVKTMEQPEGDSS